MTNSIITHDGDVINYANIVRIAIFTASGSATGDRESVEDTIYLIEAATNIKLDDEESSFTLAAYDDMTKAENAMEQIVKWLENGMKSVFRMPE